MGEIRSFTVSILSLSFLDQIVQKIASLISFLIITNFLPIDVVGQYGVVLSFMAFVSFFVVSPENVVLRDYGKHKGNMKLFLGSVLYFFKLRMLVVIPIIAIAVFLFYSTGSVSAILFFMFYALVSLAGAIQSFIRDLFYLEKRYFLGLSVFVFYSISLAGSAISIIFFKDLVIFGALLFFSNVIISLVYILILSKINRLSFRISKESKAFAKKIFVNFGFWNHVNGNLSSVLYKLDPLILSFFAIYSQVGFYTIALLISNYFMIYPMLMQKTLQMTLARIDALPRIESVFRKSIRYFVLVSFGQMIVFVFFGYFILSFFAKENILDVYKIALIILAGVSILNFFRPFLAFLGRVIDQKILFTRVFLPSVIIGLLAYISLTAYFGFIGTALGNVVSYIAFAICMLLLKISVDKGKTNVICER